MSKLHAAAVITCVVCAVFSAALLTVARETVHYNSRYLNNGETAVDTYGQIAWDATLDAGGYVVFDQEGNYAGMLVVLDDGTGDDGRGQIQLYDDGVMRLIMGARNPGIVIGDATYTGDPFVQFSTDAGTPKLYYDESDTKFVFEDDMRSSGNIMCGGVFEDHSGTDGIDSSISVWKGDDSGACTITVSDGIITAEDCP